MVLVSSVSASFPPGFWIHCEIKPGKACVKFGNILIKMKYFCQFSTAADWTLSLFQYHAHPEVT